MFPVPVYVGSADEPKNGLNKVISDPKFPFWGFPSWLAGN